MESERSLAPVLCGGILPNARATSREMTPCHFPALPACSRPSRSSVGRTTRDFCPIAVSDLPQFSSVTHSQNAGRRCGLIPPSRTASRITVCSFSAKTRLQNLFALFIRHTAAGSPRKPRKITTRSGWFQIDVSKGLGLVSGALRYFWITTVSNNSRSELEGSSSISFSLTLASQTSQAAQRNERTFTGRPCSWLKTNSSKVASSLSLFSCFPGPTSAMRNGFSSPKGDGNSDSFPTR